MPFIPPEIIEKARQVDLLSYLKACEPGELVKISNGHYCTREHDSLKISNGKWYWFSRGFGGYNALDYLIKVKEIPFLEAVERITGQAAYQPQRPHPAKPEKPKVLLLPNTSRSTSRVHVYLRSRGIDAELIDFCIQTGRLYESEPHHNAVFVGLDKYNKPRYANLRGLGTDFVGDATGSDKRFSFSIPAPGSNTVHLFESAIDLLSYATLVKRNGGNWQREHLVSLRILHDFYRSGEEVYFRFDMEEMMKKGHDFRDYICPDSMEKRSDYLMLGGKYARVIYLKEYASFISDKFVTKLTDQTRSMMLSIDIVPVATDEAVREVERKMLGVETNITNWQRRQNANNNFSAMIPYDMELQRKETKEYMDDLTGRDQRMMLAVLTIVHLADNKEQLDADTEALLKVGADHVCQMAVLRYQQLDGLNTALPIGTRKIDTFRTLTTESLAAFMPFKVQEIQEPGGIYIGENAVSHNLILCNMNNLLNQSMMLLGIPGSGKSFFAKLLIISIALSSKDDIIILDPEGEYTPLVKALGGSVIRFAVGGTDWLNAMDMENGYGEGSPVAFKSQFIMSLLKQVDPDGIGPHQKSIIDRCVAEVCKEKKQGKGSATLCTIREKLLEQPEPEARDIALTMELYTSGSLDIFAHETNVDTRNRIISYDIHDLSEDLKQPGFVTITDAMLNRVNYNWAQGKKTHVIVDEFHIAYENEYSGNFFTSASRQFRKRNASPLAITQNVDYLLSSTQASTMLSNSEFIVMLNQAENDQERLSKLLNISPEQMRYVNGSEAGCGLLRYGDSLVPFVNKFPANTELYKLITTRPGEGVFAKGQVILDA